MSTKVGLDLTLVTHGSDLPELNRRKMLLAILDAAQEVAANYGYYVESACGGWRLCESYGGGRGTITYGLPDDGETKP